MSNIDEIIKEVSIQEKCFFTSNELFAIKQILELHRVALLEKAAEEALIVVDTEWNEYFEPITTYEVDKSSITNIKLD